jgi:hypothetical protein
MSSKTYPGGQAQSPRPLRCVLIFLAYRPGLGAAEVVDLHREQVDHKTADAVRAEGQERHSQVFSPIVERARLVADLGIKGDVHMLRHSTGYNDALMMLRLNMADPHLMSASRRQLRLTTSMSFSSSRCARCSRVRRAAFVGRRGVERRALFVFQWLA